VKTKWIAYLLIAILGLLLAIGAGLLVDPTWLTGGYCEITFTRIEMDSTGRIELNYDLTLSYKLVEEWVSIPGSGGSNSSSIGWRNLGKGFLRCPRTRSDIQMWPTMWTDEDPAGTLADIQTLRNRMVLKPGTYRIRNGESLVWGRSKHPDGSLAEGKIRVYAESGRD